MSDLAIVAFIMLGSVAATLAVLAWQEHEEAKRQRRRAEEMTAWADGTKVVEDAPYEAFQRSCMNITDAWKA